MVKERVNVMLHGNLNALIKSLYKLYMIKGKKTFLILTCKPLSYATNSHIYSDGTIFG